MFSVLEHWCEEEGHHLWREVFISFSLIYLLEHVFGDSSINIGILGNFQLLWMWQVVKWECQAYDFFFWYAVGSIKLVLGGGGKEGTVRKKNILTTPRTRNDRLVIHLFNAAVWIDEPSKTPLIYCTFWAAKELCKGKVIPFLSHKIYFMSCWHWWKDTKRCHTDDSNDMESWDAILEITETFTEIQLR